MTSITDNSGRSFGVKKVFGGDALQWIQEAWQLFSKRPGFWIGMFLFASIVPLVLNNTPIVGPGVGMVASTFMGVGMTWLAFRQETAQNVEFGDIFWPLKNKAAPILQYLCIFLAVSVLAVAGILLTLYSSGMAASLMEAFNSQNSATMLPQIAGRLMTVATPLRVVILLAIVGVTVFFLVTATIFAPTYIVVGNLSAVQAMRLSFANCAKNWWPITVWSLLMMLMAFASVITLFIGFLVVGPLWHLSLYRAAISTIQNATQSTRV